MFKNGNKTWGRCKTFLKNASIKASYTFIAIKLGCWEELHHLHLCRYMYILIASMSWEMEFPDVASKQFLVKWQILSWLCNMMKNILTQKNFLSDSFQTFYVFSWRKENSMSHSNTKVTDKRSIESSFTYEYIFMYSISLILIAPAVCINDTHFRILWLKKLFVKKVWK